MSDERTLARPLFAGRECARTLHRRHRQRVHTNVWRPFRKGRRCGPQAMERVFVFYRLTHGPEGPQDLLDALRSAATVPFAEPGCRSSRIWREADECGALLLTEEWETSQEFEQHMRSPAFHRLLEVLELSRTAPEILYVQGSRLRGLDWIVQVLGP